MHTRPIRSVVLAVLVLFVGVATAEVARAQAREFTGTVVSAGGSITVEDRRGERVTFTRTKKTVVKGRPNWGAIAVGDRVLVRWALADGTRARRVIVLETGS